MTPLLRIGGFVAVLALVFGAATLAGAKLDPSVEEQAGEHEEDGSAADGDGGSTPSGLAVAENGYRLLADTSPLPRAGSVAFRFQIAGPDGETVRDFDLEHERRMHLILVRRDFQEFQHLHPRQLEDGTWAVRVGLSKAGVYRAFADFSTGGAAMTLATDLFVAGDFEPRPLAPPSTVAAAGDEYEVELDSDPPVAGTVTPVRFTVHRRGHEVETVEPYLGAGGHLVALREHDQAFLHTHPQGAAGGPGPIEFGVEYPTAGRYRLFLQFRHRGEVRTAAFTQEVPASGDAAAVKDHDAQETPDGH